ncbi:E3 ubiquitin/ISG15 ligase TRIM25-like [Rhinophrynus dorsalis]
MASADLREELNCSICLNIYTDPVNLGCGHNFCRVCIGNVLDTQEGSGVYSCPECRAEFQERPALQRNMKLCNIVELFLSTHPDQEVTGIICTYCIHSPVPAVKTCVMCEACLCKAHLNVHSKSPEHILTDPTTFLGNRKCPIHKELLKYHCSEDGVCICVSCCLVGEHRGHQVELMNEASDKKKETLRNVLEKLKSKREETEKRVQNLKERRREVRGKSASETQRVTALIRDIREQLEALEKRVLSEISRQEEQVSLQVSDLIHQLEIKKNELSRKIRHIEELSNTTDPLMVLQRQELDTAETGDNEVDGDKDNGDDYDERRIKHDKNMYSLDEIQIFLTLEADILSTMVGVQVIRELHVPQDSDIMLDTNTACSTVAVSDDMKMASCIDNKHYYYIVRKGHQAVIGNNDKSWCFNMEEKSWYSRMEEKKYSVMHDSKSIPLHIKSSCKLLGIFLDYEDGRLSFYQLSGSVEHLYTFTATFTEPLHAAFLVKEKSWVRISS